EPDPHRRRRRRRGPRRRGQARREGARHLRRPAALGMTRAAVLAAVLLAVACAPRPVVERAIAARGGAVAGLVRDSDVQVAMGFPGAWQWRTVTALPDRYAWSITTNDQPHHYLFDGTEVRAFIGTALVSEDTTATALKTHARFVAVA